MICDNVNNGAVINKNFEQWAKIKTEKQHKAWEKKVVTILFGSYKNIDITEMIENFNPIKGVNYSNYIAEIKSAFKKAKK